MSVGLEAGQSIGVLVDFNYRPCGVVMLLVLELEACTLALPLEGGSVGGKGRISNAEVGRCNAARGSVDSDIVDIGSVAILADTLEDNIEALQQRIGDDGGVFVPALSRLGDGAHSVAAADVHQFDATVGGGQGVGPNSDTLVGFGGADAVHPERHAIGVILAVDGDVGGYKVGVGGGVHIRQFGRSRTFVHIA